MALGRHRKVDDEIVEELARHPNGIGAKYAKRLFAEVTRCFNKWKKRRMASVGMVGLWIRIRTGASSAAVGAISWPQIKVIPHELPRVVNEAEERSTPIRESSSISAATCWCVR